MQIKKNRGILIVFFGLVLIIFESFSAPASSTNPADKTALEEGGANLPENFIIIFPFRGPRFVNSGYSPFGGSSLHGRKEKGFNGRNDRGLANDYYALDFSLNYEPVLAVASGTVVYAGWTGGGWSNYGRIVIIDHGNQFQSLYAHLSEIKVKVGDFVTQRQEIAISGGSRNKQDVKGFEHLHFAMYKNAIICGDGISKKCGSTNTVEGGPHSGQSVLPEPLGGYYGIKRGDILPPPKILVIPKSGPQGKKFWVLWRNFSPSNTLTSHLQKPDRSEFPVKIFPTDQYGNAKFAIDSSTLPLGQYILWAEDNYTKEKTEKVSFIVENPNICKTNPLACIDIAEPPLEEDFLSCAAGEDGLIDDSEIVWLLDAWQKQKDYQGCGVPTDDDYMRALALWIKRQPVDEGPIPHTQNPIARLTITTGNGQTAQENEEITLTLPQGEENLGVILSAANSYDPDGGSIRSYEWLVDNIMTSNDPKIAIAIGPGTHQILLTVTDDEGQTGVARATIVIVITEVDTDNDGIPDKNDRCPNQWGPASNNGCPENRLPVIFSLTYEPASPTPDDIVYFEVRASDPDGDPLTYEWYLNGVKQVNATAAIVQWANPPEGNYTMAVVVYDNKGGKDQRSVTFSVQRIGSQAPQITSIGIPNVLIIETPTKWQLGFSDPEGDVNWVQFEVLRGSSWQDDGGWDPEANGIKQGTIEVVTICRTLGTVNGRIWLRDARGNQSQYYYYSYQCESSSGALILRAYYKSECPVCVGDYCYDFPSVKCVVFAWQYEATDVLLFEIKSMYTDSSGYSETLNRVNPVIKEYTEMLTEDKKVCVQVRAQTSSGYTDWSNKVCATVYAITPSSRWQPELSSKVIMAKIQIFTLGGQLVYSTDFGDPKRLEWDLKDYRNLPIANGVYLVVITTNDIYGLVHREVKKIFVLR